MYTAGVALATLVVSAGAAGLESLDPSFGEGGLVTSPVGSAVAVADLAPSGHDGAMTAALASWRRGGKFAAVARFGPGGSLDPTFGTDGIATPFPAPPVDWAQTESVVAQSGGRTLVVGYRTRSSGLNERIGPLMARLRADGSLDPSFGSAGLVAPPPRREGDAYHAAAALPGGGAIAVGTRNERFGPPAGLVVAYRADGHVNRSFGRRGRVVFPARGRGSYTGLSAVSIVSGGKVLVSGFRRGRLFVARLRPDGSPDRDFSDGDGRLSVDIGDTSGCLAACGPRTALGPQGRLILVMASRPSVRTVLMRLHADGSVDRSFGHRGFVATGAGRLLSDPADLALQPGGRIVIVGTDERIDANGRIRFVFGVLRFTVDGGLDRSFGAGGLLTLPGPRGSAGFAALRQSDGKVVAGGALDRSSDSSLDYALLLARLRQGG